MTTRLTDEVLANVHGDLNQRHELHPVNNQLIAAILDRMDEITVDGYDADAAAAALFAFGTVVGSQHVNAPHGASLQDINTFLAAMATLTGQALHSQTHAVAEEPQQGTTTVVRFDSIPWPPDRREHVPAAIVGALPTAYQLEALRQYRAARGLPTLISISRLTAAEVNQAVQWWNLRAAMLDMENPQ